MVDDNGLPQPGLDRDEWGTPLNNFLLAQKDQTDTNTAGISQALAGLDLKADAAATTAALAGKAALTGATFTGPVTAPIRDNGGQVFNVKAFGAVGDGSTDDTSAIQAAVDAGNDVFFPAGTYVVSGASGVIVNRSGVRLHGMSPDTTQIKSSTGDVLTISQGTNVVTRLELSGLLVMSQAGGGHCVNVTYCMSQSKFDRLQLQQYNDNKSLLYCHPAAPGGLFDNDFGANCYYYMPPTSTVPGFDIVGTANSCSANTWRRCRMQGGGTYLVHIESQSAYSYNNVFEDINFEQADHGAIQLLGCMNTAINEVGAYDNAAITANLISIGRVTGGNQSRGTAIRSYHRSNGTLSAGVADIALIAGQVTGTTLIEGITGPTSAGVTVDLGTATGFGTIIGYDPYSVTIRNATTNTVLLTSQLGLVAPLVRSGSGVTGSRPAAATAGVGAVWFDTTLGKPIWSTGSAWVTADGTAA